MQKSLFGSSALVVLVVLAGTSWTRGETSPLPPDLDVSSFHAGEELPDPTRESPDPFDEVPLELATELPAVPGSPAALSPRPHAYSRRIRASFRLRVRDVIVPYRVLAVTALPGEEIQVEVDAVAGEDPAGPNGPGGLRDFRLRTPDGVRAPVAPGVWRWTAPSEPGPVPIRVESGRAGDAIVLNVLVLHPFDQISNGSLNGYRIGQYRTGSGRSRPPEGFIEGSPDVLDLLVAPAFTVRQFLAKQEGEPPYLALSEPLLLKLQAILEEVRVEGIEAETLFVMSGFRTPHYNRAIGNTTDGSRHLWGDAADVFIDTSGNGWMDDLNGDGRVDEADARILYRLVEQVEARGEPHVVPGGLSLYRANPVRGPFLHVDARGLPARW